MKYTVKITDIGSDVAEDMTFGTCDLCEYTADHWYDVFTLEVTDEHGNMQTVEAENGQWDWGDYSEFIEVPENAVVFMVEFNEMGIVVDTDEFVDYMGNPKPWDWDDVLRAALFQYESASE